jgi:hypothetical protein
MRFNSGDKKITAVLPQGTGRKLLEQLHVERGIHTGMLHGARGVGPVRLFGLARLGLANQVEWGVLSVIVPAAEADELFEWIYDEGGVNHPKGGFMYMGSLGNSVPFELQAES